MPSHMSRLTGGSRRCLLINNLRQHCSEVIFEYSSRTGLSSSPACCRRFPCIYCLRHCICYILYIKSVSQSKQKVKDKINSYNSIWFLPLSTHTLKSSSFKSSRLPPLSASERFLLDELKMASSTLFLAIRPFPFVRGSPVFCIRS